MKRAFWLALVGLYVAAAIGIMLLKPEWASTLAPLAGPWAGHLYGHACCTMAQALPTATKVVVVAFPFVLALAILGRRSAWSRLPVLLWALAWVALAWMSAVNTLS